MKCPACKNELVVIEHNKIELDYCTNCRGVWFDSTELDLFLKATVAEPPTTSSRNIPDFVETRTSEKKRKCPICQRSMKKGILGKEQQILIDACTQGDGLWFDGGELYQLIEQLSNKEGMKENSENKVTSFLQDVFRFH